MMMTVDVHRKCEYIGLGLGLQSYGLGLSLGLTTAGLDYIRVYVLALSGSLMLLTYMTYMLDCSVELNSLLIV